MSNSIFGIGLSGLNAAQAGLTTTGHNISNVNTPNYSRQEIVQGTNVPFFTGSGFFGTGTNVSTVKRIYDSFLATQVQQAQAGASQLNSYQAQISQIDNLLGSSTAGLTPAVNNFFSAANSVAANPNDNAARQTMLSNAQTLANQFHSIEQNFSDMRSNVNAQITSTVGTVNTLTTQIANLNRQIVLAQNQGAGTQPPNDLLDQRDGLIAQINQQIGVNAVVDSSGMANLFLGNGQALVVGEQTSALVAVADNSDPTNLQVGLQTGGSVVRFQPTQLSGGQLGGLLAFRSQTLDNAENSLGQIAIAFASAFNAQHQLGQDQNGQLGAAFFASGTPQANPALSNTGTGAITATISNVGALTTSNYSLVYNGLVAGYTLTRLSDNTSQIFAALPHTMDGVTLTLAGAPNAGDSFLIQPTKTGASAFNVLITDTSKIAAAAPIRASANAANLGRGTITAGSVNGPPPPSANLQQPVTLTFHNVGGVITYDVAGFGTGNPNGLAYTAGTNITYNGWTVAVSGTPAEGDTFTVGSNTNGVGDNRNALLLAGIQSQNIIGTAAGPLAGVSLQGAYGQLVSQIGAKTNQLQAAAQAQTSLLSQVTSSQQSVSGVNLDEEAANLLKYQQAYQAAGKVIATADKLFDTILNL
jgi:flagellar hook-associated protein 1